MRVLLVSFILVAFTRAARADGMVRAAPRVPAIAVATWGDGARAVERIRFAADGVHFRRVRLPSRRSLIDMQVLDDRALVILAADSGKRFVVTRVVGERRVAESFIGEESPGGEVFRMVSNGRDVALLGVRGVFWSRDGGRTFPRFGRWPARTDDFERVSAWLSTDGTLDVLALGYNYCASVDRLETIQRLRMNRDGVASQATLPFGEHSDSLFLARFGTTFATDDDRKECMLFVDGAGTAPIARYPYPYCGLSGADNGRFTLVTFGEQVFRVGGRAPQRVAEIPEPYVAGPSPDHRGRALVLHDDGRLVRYARRAPPRVILAKCR